MGPPPSLEYCAPSRRSVNSSVVSESADSSRQSIPSPPPVYFEPTQDELLPSLRTISTDDSEGALKYHPGSDHSQPSEQTKWLGWIKTKFRRSPPKEKRQLTWVETTWVLTASQISLGVLNLPTAVAQVGLFPALCLMFSFQVTCTYTGYAIWQYMLKHHHCDSFADLMAIWSQSAFGSRKPGRWMAEIMVNIYLLFLMAAHINVWRDLLYVLSGNTGECRIVFGFSGAAIILLINLIFPFEESTWLSALSSMSIISAVFIAMFSVATGNPAHGNWYWFIGTGVPGITVSHSGMGVSNIALSYVGHPMYPSIISGMKARKDFWKSLLAFEAVRAVFLTLVGCLFYVYGGQSVVSPALGAASKRASIAAYSTAIPTILMAGAIPAYLIANGLNKHFWEFVGQPERTNMAGWKTKEQVKAQIPIKIMLIVLWIVAFVLAMSIPVFEELLGLMGALFATTFGLIIPSLFWWDMFKNDQLRATSKRKRRFLMSVNAIVPVVGIAVLVLGVYGSGVQINLTAMTASPPFSCRVPGPVLKTIQRFRAPG